MKKITPILIAIAFLSACMPTERTAEQITLEISETRAQISDLNTQLAELESELAAAEQDSSDQGIKVETFSAALQPFETYVNISAVIEAVNEAMISPESNGKIMKVHVEEGDRVSKGQLLVTLDSEIMQNSLSELEKSLELTKTMYQKQKELYEQGVGSEVQFLQVENQYEALLKSKETLESQLKMAKIRAPFNGYIEKIYQKEGELATPGRQIIHLVNLSNLYIKTELSENYLGSVQKGDSVWVTFPHYPDMMKTAKITQVGKIINPASRTFSIRIEMKNTGEKLKPNMMADIKIRNYFNPEVLVLPTTFIRQDLNGDYIFVARQHDGDSFAVKTYVSTGKTNGVKTEIMNGIEAGDLVISKGFNQVRDGNQIMIVN